MLRWVGWVCYDVPGGSPAEVARLVQHPCMPLAKDEAIELEPLKTLKTPRLTLIFLSSSLDTLMGGSAETIHEREGPRPFALSQNILPQKRGGGNSMITLEL
jgi:hypothetical protein